MNRKDDAFRLLDRAYQERANGMSLLKVIPTVDPLRSDLRFTALLTLTKSVVAVWPQASCLHYETGFQPGSLSCTDHNSLR